MAETLSDQLLIRVEPSTKLQLESLARKRNCSVATIVRESIATTVIVPKK